MKQFTVKGTLPIGVEHDGKVHTEFEIRSAFVRDSVEVYDLYDAERLERNNLYSSICLTCYRLESLGAIPKVEITPELLMTMFNEDLAALNEASDQAAAKARTFRNEASGKESQEAGGPAPKA